MNFQASLDSLPIGGVFIAFALLALVLYEVGFRIGRWLQVRTPEEKVMRALQMLLVKVDLAGLSFVLGVTEETPLEWLRRAARQAEIINAHLLRELPVTQVQLAELWTFIVSGNGLAFCKSLYFGVSSRR